MLTVADMGEGGVKNPQKSADVLYGRSPSQPAYIHDSANQVEPSQ